MAYYYNDRLLFPPRGGGVNTGVLSFIPIQINLSIVSAFSLRIAIASNQHGIDFKPSKAFGTAPLWTEFFARRQFILHNINESISTHDVETMSPNVLRRIVDLLTAEVCLYKPLSQLNHFTFSFQPTNRSYSRRLVYQVGEPI